MKAYEQGDFKWEDDRVVFQPNGNGRYLVGRDSYYGSNKATVQYIERPPNHEPESEPGLLDVIIYNIGKQLAERIDFELWSANQKFPPFNSPHEGYAVLLEEMDELWDEIKNNGGNDRIKEEAIQVAAMAIKLIKSLKS